MGRIMKKPWRELSESDILEYLLSKCIGTENPHDCWIYQGACDPTGHGRIKWRYRSWKAHRLAWRLRFGCAPPQLNHKRDCSSPACVNWDHLYVGTKSENMLDAVAVKELKGENHWSSKLSNYAVREVR